MGRTSKLSRKFDMILVAIFLIGMLMVLLYLAGRYECGEGIALIIGGVCVIIIETCFLRKMIIVKYKKNGLVTLNVKNIGIFESKVIIRGDKHRQNIVKQVLKLQYLALVVKRRIEYINENINVSINKISITLLIILRGEILEMEKRILKIRNLFEVILNDGLADEVRSSIINKIEEIQIDIFDIRWDVDAVLCKKSDSQRICLLSELYIGGICCGSKTSVKDICQKVNSLAKSIIKQNKIVQDKTDEESDEYCGFQVFFLIIGLAMIGVGIYILFNKV